MKGRKTLAAAMLGTLCACTTAAPTPPSNEGNATQARMSTSDVRRTLNSIRASAGLPPMTEDRRLSRAAARHAAYMARSDTRTHIGPRGGSFAQRASAAGYCYSVLAENIAWGIPDDSTVLDGWMNSAGHRRNMLHPDVTHYGIAGVDGYWVLDVAAPC
ncbi:CAP domain-containing protein [Pelagovum pacificum]|uniref:CAP domain-containing protein n=1 Tax=Pelagovum pacificum TaxID=2588711 RepID=A0A5C5GCI3_9RHOB|nr:CAP domain-containing protein [Pelagovum pacificum]QQA44361.1 CAP domain-containing protein [Pelagovum pacificum]TNY32522.1 CAP domain-containing protein [Pelagovum pacificum]